MKKVENKKIESNSQIMTRHDRELKQPGNRVSEIKAILAQLKK